MVSRIADEHRALDALFARALSRLNGNVGELESRDAVEELREALESHLSAEEDLYFPTVWALRPEYKDRFRSFIRAHHRFRGLIHEITGLMDSRETEEAVHVLERLKDEFGTHEAGEEDAIDSLDQEILDDQPA